MKKFILLMLVTALIALPVLSCAADEGDNGQPGGPAETGEPGMGEQGADEVTEEECEDVLQFPDLPDVHFGGYEFRIFNVANETSPWQLTTVVVEEETGEALNDAIFRRNRRMEERFGFTLVQTDFGGTGAVVDAARRSIQAASDDFDLAMIAALRILPLAQDGMLEMIDRIPYVDLSQPWWDQDMIRDFSIGNRLFFAASSFTFNHYSATVPVLFNKQLHADLGLDCPYQLVHEGRWTLDRFAEMGRAALRDLNGDGIFDHNDQWGYLAFYHIYGITLLNGLDTGAIVKDADDMPVLNTGAESYITRVLALMDVLNEGWLFDGTVRGVERPEHIFLEGRALFWSEFLNWATILRGMDNDFGILPMPKFDEQQERHRTGVGGPHVKAIPVTTVDLERTGIILEALSAESRLTTLPVYYDTMLVNQVMNRNEESAEMLDIIFANRAYEPGRLFWGPNVSTPIARAIRDNNRDVASLIERHEPAALASIQSTIDAFLN